MDSIDPFVGGPEDNRRVLSRAQRTLLVGRLGEFAEICSPELSDNNIDNHELNQHGGRFDENVKMIGDEKHQDIQNHKMKD